MNAKRFLLIGAGLLSISAAMPPAYSAEGGSKLVMITRLYGMRRI